MYKKMIYLISFALALGVVLTSPANADDPSLVGWWKLDDEGTDKVLDYSGNGRDGTINGEPQYVPGLYNEAMEFHGDPDYINIDDYKGLLGGHAFSIAAWIKTSGNGEIVSWGNNTGTERIEFRINEYRLRTGHGSGNRQGDTFVSDNEWHHVALTVEENATISYPEVILYLDGEDDTRSGTDPDAFNIVSNFDVKIGRQYNSNNRWFIGLMDDVRIYDRALSPEEIKELAAFPRASNPSPADGAVHPQFWAYIRWSPGANAASHDIYFSDNFADVNAGAEGAFRRNQAETNFFIGYGVTPEDPCPDGLVQNTTYYWRIDEIETDGTKYKGDIWSFMVPPMTASNPEPADGARFVDPNVTLSWTPGFDARAHYVYSDDNFDDVNNAAEGLPQSDITYTPGTLAPDKTYYWRVDEFDGTVTHKGDVWSFRTEPFIPIYDPNLVGWWKLDDEGSGTVIDYSGYGHHGTLNGDPQWAAGYDGDALEFDGSGDYVRMDGYKGVLGTSAFSITAWIKTTNSNRSQIIGWGNTGAGHKVEFWVNSNRLRCDANGGNVQGDTNLTDNEWHHAVVTVKENATISSGDVTIYLDGQEDTRVSTDTDAFDITSNFDVKIGQMYDLSGSRWYIGLIDDVRIYSKLLTPEEIEKAMAGDPRLAYDPNPANGSTPNIDVAGSLSWTAGDFAASHDVYFGADKIDVLDADASDTSDIYRDRQDLTNYTVPEALDYNQTYYWRVDEYNTDSTISKGKIWSFTVADFIVVDDFEDYNDYPGNRIYETWADGWEIPTNGATLGYPEPLNFAAGEHILETTDVYGGEQSLPFFYDNSTAAYSEATVNVSDLPIGRDWTRQGVQALSLWFKGYPAVVGSFTEGPAGTYTMTANGTDIWGTSDEFHFAWKQLLGPGAIIAKVESVQNTHNWAKAGVMIRDTLEADSAHAMMVVTPASGVAFQRRTVAGDTSTGTTEADITAPQWVKIERDIGGNVTASYSADGVMWTGLGSEIINMSAPMYIGLALTSHDINITTEAIFSNVQITDAISPQWADQSIAAINNAAEPMYVAVSSGGTPVAVYHDDPLATQTGDWTEWIIDLKDFEDKGIELTNVDKLSIGFGDKNPDVSGQPGGSGRMYFDDIRLYRPR